METRLRAAFIVAVVAVTTSAVPAAVPGSPREGERRGSKRRLESGPGSFGEPTPKGRGLWLTRRTLATVQGALLDRSKRVFLRNSVSGRRVCLPGVGSSDRGWDSVPGHFAVQNLLGVLVFLVEDDGSVDSRGERFRVAAVLSSRHRRPAPPSFSLIECADDDDSVSLVFGERVLEFVGLPAEERPLADLEGVGQPPTPDPFDR